MSNIFSASELVEMGIQIEKNGSDFYKTVSRNSKDKKVRDIFDFLGKEEENHIKRFEAILSGVKDYKPRDVYTEDYFSYLKALSGSYVFTKKGQGKNIAEKIKQDSEAIDLGIGFERESILFYHEMKKFILETENKVVEKLLDEERKHLVRLLELKKSV